MPARLAQLCARRCALVAESDALRAQVTAQRRVLAPARIRYALMDRVRSHPALVIGVAVALVALRPRRIRKLLAVGTGAMTLVLRAATVLSTAVRLVKLARRTGQMRR